MRKLIIALFILLPFVFANGCAYVSGSADPVVPEKGPTAEEAMQAQAEKEKWAKIRAEKAAQGRRDAVFPVQFEMIPYALKRKAGTISPWPFSLGIRPLQSLSVNCGRM